jgi:hypothetical protein
MDVGEFHVTRPKREHWGLIEGVVAMMAPCTLCRSAHRVIYNLPNAACAVRRLDLVSYFDAGVRKPGLEFSAAAGCSDRAWRGQA